MFIYLFLFLFTFTPTYLPAFKRISVLFIIVFVLYLKKLTSAWQVRDLGHSFPTFMILLVSPDGIFYSKCRSTLETIVFSDQQA